MRLTIDTTKKEIIVEESTNVSELISFLQKNDYNNYTILSRVYDFIKPFEPMPYNPIWQVFPYQGCYTTNTLKINETN